MLLVAVALSMSQPVDAEEAFAALREARRRINKLYSQLAKERPRVEPPKASKAGVCSTWKACLCPRNLSHLLLSVGCVDTSLLRVPVDKGVVADSVNDSDTSCDGAGYDNQRQAHKPRGSGDGMHSGQQHPGASSAAAGGAHYSSARSAGQHTGSANGADMQSPFLHFQRGPGMAGPHMDDPALLQSLGGLELSGRSGSGQSLQSQLSARSFTRMDSMDRNISRADSIQTQGPPVAVRGHYSTRAGYQQAPARLPSMGNHDGETAALLLQHQQALAQATLMQAGRQQPQLATHGSGPSIAASLGQQALAQAQWGAAMQAAAMHGMGAIPAGSPHLHAPAMSSAMQQDPQPARSSGQLPAGQPMAPSSGGVVGMQQEQMPGSPHARAPGFKTAGTNALLPCI